MARKPTHDQLMTLPGAAREVGIANSTLHGAIRGGHVPAYLTADGKPLVLLADVRAYCEDRPSTGPKPKLPQ